MYHNCVEGIYNFIIMAIEETRVYCSRDLGCVHHVSCEAIGFTIYYMVGYIIMLCGNKTKTILLLPQCTNLTQGILKY